MNPFADLTEATLWWKKNVFASCSILVDFTNIGKGIQRREIYRQSTGNWIITFPGER